MTQVNLNEMQKTELLELATALQVLDERKRYNKQEFLYPDTGPLSRDKYKKHLKFFEAGAHFKERALIAANRVGKTMAALMEVSYHLNGRYPNWWKGKRFEHPVTVWVVGKTHDTTKDILQKYLLGPRYDMGTGFIPKEDIVRTTSKNGIQDAIQEAYVKHYTQGINDGISDISFKSYVQGVDAFMGTQIHVVHLDEEPSNASIYTECLTRTMTTHGIVIATFTPLEGLSDIVLSFLPGGKFPQGGFGEVYQDDSDQE